MEAEMAPSRSAGVADPAPGALCGRGKIGEISSLQDAAHDCIS